MPQPNVALYDAVKNQNVDLCRKLIAEGAQVSDIHQYGTGKFYGLDYSIIFIQCQLSKYAHHAPIETSQDNAAALFQPSSDDRQEDSSANPTPSSKQGPRQ